MNEFNVILDLKDILYALEEELKHHPRLKLIDLYKLCYQAWFGPAHITSDLETVKTYIIQEIQVMQHEYHPLMQDIGNKQGFSRFSLSWFALQDTEAIQNKATILAEIMLLSAPLGRRDLGIKQLWPIVSPLVKDLYPGTPEEWEKVNAFATQELMPHHSELFIENYHPHYRVIHTTISDRIIELIS